MKKMIVGFFGAVLLVLLGVSACKKSGALPGDEQAAAGKAPAGKNVLTSNSEAAEFFARRGPAVQRFNFSTEQLPVEVKTAKGTVITIPRGAFTVAGKPAAGMVTFTVQEFTTRGDMLRGNTNTMNNDNLLETDGSFDVNATINGRPADEALARPLQFSVPVINPGVAATSLFQGVVQNDPGAQAPFNWVRPVNQPDRAVASGGRFSFPWSRLRFINCDRLRNFSPRTTLTVNLPNNPGNFGNFRSANGGGSFVAFVPRGLNGVIQLWNFSSNTSISSWPNSIPVGMTAKVVAYAVSGGQWWYAEAEIMVTPNMIIDLDLEPSDEATVTANLDALSGY